MDQKFETRCLKFAVGLGCCVPVSAGLLGMILGAGMLDHGGDATLDSHVRYLSGLLLGIGLGFASTIPKIETQGERYTLLTAIVIVGGVGRLYGVLADGWPDATMKFALAMELVVTPLLWSWQRRIGTAAGHR